MAKKTKPKKQGALSKKLKGLSVKAKLIISIILLVIVCATSYAFYYIEKNSLKKAVSELNLAIANKDFAKVSHYIDFDKLGMNFAQTYAQKYNLTSQEDLRFISHKLQELILEASKEPVEAPKLRLRDRPAPDTIEPSILPKDFIGQLQTNPFVLISQDETTGILSTKIVHPALAYEVKLKLFAEKTTAGWEIVASNAPELIKVHMDARQRLRDQRIEAFRAENMRRLNLINQHLQIKNCQVFLSPQTHYKDDVPMVITMDGINIGSELLASASVICSIKDKENNLLAQLPLSFQPNALSGAFYTQHWQIDLARDLPETKLLLKHAKLFCSMEANNVTLETSKIVYLRPETDLAKIRP